MVRRHRRRRSAPTRLQAPGGWRELAASIRRKSRAARQGPAGRPRRPRFFSHGCIGAGRLWLSGRRRWQSKRASAADLSVPWPGTGSIEDRRRRPRPCRPAGERMRSFCIWSVPWFQGSAAGALGRPEVAPAPRRFRVRVWRAARGLLTGRRDRSRTHEIEYQEAAAGTRQGARPPRFQPIPRPLGGKLFHQRPIFRPQSAARRGRLCTHGAGDLCRISDTAEQSDCGGTCARGNAQTLVGSGAERHTRWSPHSQNAACISASLCNRPGGGQMVSCRLIRSERLNLPCMPLG
jgi:hypothetical protein